ncbi:hypothetical protein FISHEDRAFT_72765 [Fistulina hepatica ATCC 64428]|nr:hypothetical protein FISHEDRAFT_72765 [Fistulina hepatica ATCC 64428]
MFSSNFKLTLTVLIVHPALSFAAPAYHAAPIDLVAQSLVRYYSTPSSNAPVPTPTMNATSQQTTTLSFDPSASPTTRKFFTRQSDTGSTSSTPQQPSTVTFEVLGGIIGILCFISLLRYIFIHKYRTPKPSEQTPEEVIVPQHVQRVEQEIHDWERGRFPRGPRAPRPSADFDPPPPYMPPPPKYSPRQSTDFSALTPATHGDALLTPETTHPLSLPHIPPIVWPSAASIRSSSAAFHIRDPELPAEHRDQASERLVAVEQP